MKREHDNDGNEGNKRRPPTNPPVPSIPRHSPNLPPVPSIPRHSPNLPPVPSIPRHSANLSPMASIPRPPTNLSSMPSIPRQSAKLPPMPSIPKVGSAQVAPPSAPKYHGTSGNPVSILSNYYRVAFKEPVRIFQYHIEFMPPVEVRGIKVKVISNLNIGEFILAGPQLFVTKDLGDGSDTNVAYKPTNGEEIMYQVTIQPVKDHKWQLEDMFKLFNLHIKKLMRSMRLEQIGRSYYDPSKAISKLYPGFFTVLQHLQGGIMLNVELKHKVVRTNTVYSEIKNVRGEDEANALFKDKVVFTIYNKKPYIVTRIDYKLKMRDTTFTDNKTGAPISVLQYTQQRYPQAMRNVRDFNQPLIVCEPKKKLPTDTRPPTYLIPELCIVSGLTESMRSNFQLMEIFKSHTLIEPEERLQRLYGLISSFSDPSIREVARVQEWDIQVQQVPVQLTARELPAEDIYLRDKCVPTSNGEWNIFNSGQVRSIPKNGDLVNWVVLFPQDYDSQSFLKDFKEVISKNINSRDTSSYANEIKNLANDIDLVVCVLPSKVIEIYKNIKKVACKERPIPTQCVTVPVLKKNNRTVLTNLALQIVGKLGGVPWSLKFEMKKETIIIGIDLTHIAGKLSCVGMVASMNNDVTAFYSRAYGIEAGTQIIKNKLGMFIKDACLEYRKVNNRFPSCIFVYRDGVGESQMKLIIDAETSQIAACLAQGNVSAEVIYVIVQRRVNARFFLLENRDEHGNVQSGTVIDTVVVASEKKHTDLGTTCDFYLVAQSLMQSKKQSAPVDKKPAIGTKNPIRYWVKHPRIDEPNATTIDAIQSITFKLCHVYYNCSKTISVPAVCKYAKKLAEMAGNFIEDRTNPILFNKLYFM